MLFEEKVFRSGAHTGAYLNYYQYSASCSDKQPLLIYIHGAGSRGNQLREMSRVGPLGEIDKGRLVPAVVVAPQCHADTWFDLFDVLLEFVSYCIEHLPIDSSRVYLCGISMGAYAAWQVAMSHPEWFAALVPVCGGGMYWNAARLKHLPIWAFHGALDATVLPEESIHMVQAINQCGGQARLTIYPHANHDSWTAAYAEDEMWDWLFQQKKTCSVKGK